MAGKRKNPFAIDSKFVPVRSKEIYSREGNDGFVSIIRLNNEDHFFCVGGIAAELWLLIDDKRDMSEICKRLMKKHKPPREKFEKGVKQLMKDLLKRGLIAEMRPEKAG